MTPPLIARWLLSRTLPPDDRRVVIADLDDEFARVIVPSRSAASARRWYWWQVLASLPAVARMRLRGQLRDAGRDLRHGGRLLGRNPTFALSAILTLTLGIAATSSVMTVANAVLLRPLPYLEPDRVVSVAEIHRDRDDDSGDVSWPDYLDYQQQNQSVIAMAGYDYGGSRTLTQPGQPAERVSSAGVTGHFFDVLGVRAALGRTFTDADNQNGAAPVVIVTHHAWQTRFGGDRNMVGQMVMLNGVATMVVGVLPEAFEFPPRGQAELWVPLRPSPSQVDRKYFHWMHTIGRLRPGVTVAQANADFARIAQSFSVDDPKYHAHNGARVVRLSDSIVGDARGILLILFAASVFVLLVACANIAGLLLARSTSRSTEMEVRAALGASRGRMLRQLLAESLALAIPGGLFGLVMGQWAVRLFVAAIPAEQRTSLPHLNTLSLDMTTIALGVGLTLVAALLFGLVPAVRGAGRRLLSSRGAVGGTVPELRAQSTFITVQVALALVLLFGAGLLTQSVRRLLNVPAGFSTERLAIMTVEASGPRYQSNDAVRAFHADLLERVAALPDVRGVTTIDRAPLTGSGNNGSFSIRGAAVPAEHSTRIRTIAPNYFDVMGIPLIAGRRFVDTDDSAGPRVVMINQLLATTVFDGQPMGQRVTFPFIAGTPALEIVGIVGDERFDSLDREMTPVLYFPYAQGPDSAFDVMVRTAGAASSLLPSLRAEVGRVDPGVTVSFLTTIEEVMRGSVEVFQRRSVLLLVGVFAVAAVLLAAIGLYGVLTQVVEQRSREIGVRVALGASSARILRAVLRPGLVAVTAGISIGLGGAVLVGRALSNLLFETSPLDMTTITAVVLTLVATAGLAALVPGRRALRVSAADALRRDS